MGLHTRKAYTHSCISSPLCIHQLWLEHNLLLPISGSWVQKQLGFYFTWAVHVMIDMGKVHIHVQIYATYCFKVVNNCTNALCIEERKYLNECMLFGRVSQWFHHCMVIKWKTFIGTVMFYFSTRHPMTHSHNQWTPFPLTRECVLPFFRTLAIIIWSQKPSCGCACFFYSGYSLNYQAKFILKPYIYLGSTLNHLEAAPYFFICYNHICLSHFNVCTKGARNQWLEWMSLFVWLGYSKNSPVRLTVFSVVYLNKKNTTVTHRVM